MCYDLSFYTIDQLLDDYFSDIELPADFNIDPDMHLHVMAHSFRKHPVIIFEEGRYKVKMFEWGLIGDFMNTPEAVKRQRSTMCNARSEKILGDKKSYWHRIRKQRCLVPATGIFEHRDIKGWKNKVPYFIQLKDRKLFCIPGLYHYSPIPDVETGEIKGTFTLITRAANSVMEQIHNCGDNAFRMPLFLTKELEMQWLNPSMDDPAMAEVLAFEMPSGELEHRTVYTIRSTKPRPDNKSKTDPYNWPNLPPLGNDGEQVKQAALF